jgi:hypothetical protein
LAGAVPARLDGTWVTDTFAGRAHAAFQNLAPVAEAAGSSPELPSGEHVF